MTTINGSTFAVINGTTTESVICEILVPQPQGIYLRVTNDSGISNFGSSSRRQGHDLRRMHAY